MYSTLQYVKETEGKRQRGKDTREETQERDVVEETHGKKQRGRDRGEKTGEKTEGKNQRGRDRGVSQRGRDGKVTEGKRW